MDFIYQFFKPSYFSPTLYIKITNEKARGEGS